MRGDFSFWCVSAVSPVTTKLSFRDGPSPLGLFEVCVGYLDVAHTHTHVYAHTYKDTRGR